MDVLEIYDSIYPYLFKSGDEYILFDFFECEKRLSFLSEVRKSLNDKPPRIRRIFLPKIESSMRLYEKAISTSREIFGGGVFVGFVLGFYTRGKLEELKAKFSADLADELYGRIRKIIEATLSKYV